MIHFVKQTLKISFLLLCVSFAFSACPLKALFTDYDEPTYTVTKEYNDDFEIRQYSDYLVAETIVTGDFDKVGREAFNILVSYIKGNNYKQTASASGEESESEPIPMTAPVISSQAPTTEESESISMTAPVLNTPGKEKDTYVYSFVMPAEYTLETIPKPKNPSIKIRKVAGKQMAAFRYSGTWSEKRYKKYEKELLENIQKQGFEKVGEPQFARYNAPFTLWFMRRNEILLEVKEKR